MAVLLMLLTGCGMARFAYNNGETLSYMWLDRYVNFTDEQRHRFKPELSRIFDWHRRSQLPAYIKLLEGAKERVDRPATQIEVKADADRLRQRLLMIVESSLPAMAEVALSMQPDQLAHLQNKFSDNNEDYRKDNLDGDIEQRQRARYRKALKQAEHFFGNLDRDQKQRLRQLSDARPLNNELVLQVRMRRQQEMLVLLRRMHAEKPSREEAIRRLRDYVIRSQDYFGNREHEAHYRAHEAGTVRLITELINGTNAAQKAHFKDTLQHWIDDFERLTGR